MTVATPGGQARAFVAGPLAQTFEIKFDPSRSPHISIYLYPCLRVDLTDQISCDACTITLGC